MFEQSDALQSPVFRIDRKLKLTALLFLRCCLVGEAGLDRYVDPVTEPLRYEFYSAAARLYDNDQQAFFILLAELRTTAIEETHRIDARLARAIRVLREQLATIETRVA